jgi:hypothetical protein
MDSVRETPLKNRPLDVVGASQGTAASPYILDDEVEDDYETVATIPLDGAADERPTLHMNLAGNKPPSMYLVALLASGGETLTV